MAPWFDDLTKAGVRWLRVGPWWQWREGSLLRCPTDELLPGLVSWGYEYLASLRRPGQVLLMIGRYGA